MEKQKATTAKIDGERVKASFSLRLRSVQQGEADGRAQKAVRVWSMGSQ